MELTPNDVLSGRGASFSRHPGNEIFRRMLDRQRVRTMVLVFAGQRSPPRSSPTLWMCIDLLHLVSHPYLTSFQLTDCPNLFQLFLLTGCLLQ